MPPPPPSDVKDAVVPVVPAVPSFAPTWQIPVAFEPHLERGLFTTTAGLVAGGVVGLVLFKSGSGNRAMSVATGAGFGIGRKLQRSTAT